MERMITMMALRQFLNERVSAHVIGGDPSVSRGLFRETLLMLRMEFVPQCLELPGKRPDQIFLL